MRKTTTPPTFCAYDLLLGQVSSPRISLGRTTVCKVSWPELIQSCVLTSLSNSENPALFLTKTQNITEELDTNIYELELMSVD